MKTTSYSLVLVSSLVFFTLHGGTCFLSAQDEPQKPTAEATENIDPVSTGASFSEKDITLRVKELDSATDLDEAVLAAAKESYLKAKEKLYAAKKLQAEAKDYLAKAESAPQELEAVREELEQNTDEVAAPIESEKQIELQNQLAEKSTLLKTSREELTRLTSEPVRRQARLLELPALIGAATEEQDKFTTQLEQIDETLKPQEAAARRTDLGASKFAAEQKIAAVEAERKFYAATNELLPLQRELLERRIQRLQAEIKLWQEAIAVQREDEIDSLKRKAENSVRASPSELKAAAEKNVDLVAQYRAVSKQLSRLNELLNESKLRLEKVQTEFETSKERVESVGLNDSLGLTLRRNKSELNALRQKMLPSQTTNDELMQLNVALFDLQDLASRASATDSSVGNLLTELGIPVSQLDALKQQALSILEQRRRILTPLVQSQSELLNLTMEQDTTGRRVVGEIDSFINYIDEHILWIRSGPVFGKGEVQTLSEAASWTFHPNNWMELPAAFARSVRRKLGLFMFLVIASLGLILFRRRMRKNIKAEGDLAAAGACRTFVPTFNTLINSLLLAATAPFIMIAIGLMLRNNGPDVFVQAVSQSLITIGLAIYPFELLRQTCRRGGLGERHFNWPETMQRFLRANLTWLTPTIAVLLFFVCLLQNQPNEVFRNSLGRLIMIVLLFVWGVYVFKVLHPKSKFYRGAHESDRNDGWYRFRALTFFLIGGVVVGLLLFTLGGYYYSTYQVGSRLIQTHGLVVGMGLLYEMSMRWLLVRRRRLKLEHLELRRAEAHQQIETGQSLSDQVKVDLRNEPGLDANDVSKQTGQLLVIALAFVGIWFGWKIWADVFPAIGFLNRIDLWTVTVAGIKETVTMQGLVLAMSTIVGTIFAVKNLPGILELLLLNRLPMDAGARYAVSTIVRYVVMIIGVIVAFAFIKVQWSQFSWLVAAISVGLGFGLQEIVANFVSGLILLLERPVRVGDVVTIEGTTGVVSRIQMRATTVTNFDQQELVVPNKNLITNSIFNWTLSNVLTRITVEVGVDYGADPEVVQQLIMDILKSHPEVIADPAPVVTFQNFGDNSLNFVGRCCISGPDKRLKTIHELHVAVHRGLADAGIAIPFPQRDVHMIASHPQPGRGPSDASNT